MPKLVTVSSDETAAVMRQLDELIGEVDGDEPRVVKRVRILDAATALFIGQGYRKTSMDGVAKAAGVAKGTLYLYFEKKIDLLIAAIGREKKAYLHEMGDIFDASLPARRRLRAYCIALLLASSRMPLARRLFQGDELAAVFAELPPALVAQADHNQNVLIVPLIREVAGDHTWTELELQDRAKVLSGLGAYSALLTQEHVLSGLSPQRHAEILADLILDGLSRKERKQ